jgi:hypothetical protein
MPFLISVGSVGRARQNKFSTGAKGYLIVRRGKIVNCYWAGIYALGPSTYVWRRKPAHTSHRFRTPEEAREFYSKWTRRLQYSTYGYVPLGAKVRIQSNPRAAAMIREALKVMRRSGG